jgi:hypothetical protein
VPSASGSARGRARGREPEAKSACTATPLAAPQLPGRASSASDRFRTVFVEQDVEQEGVLLTCGEKNH